MCARHEAKPLSSLPVPSTPCRFMLLAVRAMVLVMAVSGAEATAAPSFADPAPPVVADADAPAIREPQPNPDVRFHATPKPLPADAVTADWPAYPPPGGVMTSAETRLLRDVAAGSPARVWEMPKGEGFAPPAVVGDRLFLFHRVGDEAVLDCLSATNGARYWRFTAPTGYRDRYGYNGGPRCGPVIAGNRVFTFGADGQLHCIDLRSGRARWRRDILKEFGVPQNFFGVGVAPLVEGDRLIVHIGAPGGPCVAAFDTETGRMVWGAGTEWGQSYAAPVAATVAGRRRVFVFAGGESDPPTGGLLVIDPADGRVEFSFPWRGRRVESVNASAPVAFGDRVFISECYGAGGAMLEAAAGGAWRTAWTNAKFDTHFMTAVRSGDHLFGVTGHGPGDAWLTCVEFATGREAWRLKPAWTNTVPTATGPRDVKSGIVRGWLLLVDGRCLCLGEYGDLLWLDLDPSGYRPSSRTRLFTAPETWTPPVLSRGLLYICQNRPDPSDGTPPRLICFDLRAMPH